MASIKIERFWDVDDVRRCCIRHNYYTHGTNEEYMAMFASLSKEPITDDELERVATDIHSHSDMEFITMEDVAMFLLDEATFTSILTNERAW